MKRLDRVALIAIALGLWAHVGALVFAPSAAISFSSSVERDIEDIIENCGVDGEVYIYDMPYGEIDGANIDC